ncbi:MAG: 3-phosphoserine/phosphohydroxythreonine transaminase [Spirochaetota bacterium]
MARKYNFYAGPSTLPVAVLNELEEEIADYRGQGLSMIETSHRSKMYEKVHNEAISLLRELLAVPEDREILFLGGGATLQFSMVPMNFLGNQKSCDMVVSGAWAKKALSDAQKLGTVKVLFDGAEGHYTSLPDPADVRPHEDAAYLHITSNETIGGLQWKEFPDTGDVPLVADMSSDIAGRRVPMEKFDLVYAGAQKNLGPAGVTVVIMKKDMLDKARNDLPVYLSYATHVEKNSLHNTPPVFSIYAMQKVLAWLKANGGIEAAEKRNEEKAGLIYQAMESSGGFYVSPVERAYRSTMNVVFRLPTEELETLFVQEAEAAGMLGLKGHRSVGGVRASLYNAVPLEGAQTLAEFMKDFAAKNG